MGEGGQGGGGVARQPAKKKKKKKVGLVRTELDGRGFSALVNGA